MRFAPEYIRYVLNDNFEDAKKLLLSPMIAMHYAHLVMLADQGIVSREDAHAIRVALDTIDENDIRTVVYDGTYEDLFFYTERIVEQACGPDVAGRLHTARSRNDIDMTLYRMRQRDRILGLIEGTIALRRALIDLAERHRETVFAMHTHTQPAQPSTVAHYLLAVIEQFGRDAARLEAAYVSTNRNPLGACAITGTGFPIDRRRTSELLGFDEPTRNTYGSIATVDYVLESLGATSVMLVGMGRFIQDMLLWCTLEFQYLRLPDGYVQGSSIMPQKRNPVALEHARAISSRALGQAMGVTTAVHNTPFGDIVDTEDDLQPLIDGAFHDADRAIHLVAAAMNGADVNREMMHSRAGANWITITELADTLTREHDLAFVKSHAIAGRLIRRRADLPDEALHASLAAVSAEVLGAPLMYEESRLRELLSPEHFVAVRTTWGGPAPSETAAALAAERERTDTDAAWLDERRTRLQAAAAARHAASRAL